MPCIKTLTSRHGRLAWPLLAGSLMVCLSACQLLPPKAVDQPAAQAKGGGTPSADARQAIDEAQERLDTSSGTAKGKAGKTSAASQPIIKLPPPATPRTMAEARQQAARRLVAANPNITYTSRPPDVLLAIPVFSVELNANGSIRRIEVMRYPRQAKDTVEIAKQALQRAAPFGDLSRVPKPWKFNETFLFNDQRKFKPLTLDR